MTVQVIIRVHQDQQILILPQTTDHLIERGRTRQKSSSVTPS
jgi:hypothetical protein